MEQTRILHWYFSLWAPLRCFFSETLAWSGLEGFIQTMVCRVGNISENHAPISAWESILQTNQHSVSPAFTKNKLVLLKKKKNFFPLTSNPFLPLYGPLLLVVLWKTNHAVQRLLSDVSLTPSSRSSPITLNSVCFCVLNLHKRCSFLVSMRLGCHPHHKQMRSYKKIHIQLGKPTSAAASGRVQTAKCEQSDGGEKGNYFLTSRPNWNMLQTQSSEKRKALHVGHHPSVLLQSCSTSCRLAVKVITSENPYGLTRRSGETILSKNSQTYAWPSVNPVTINQTGRKRGRGLPKEGKWAESGQNSQQKLRTDFLFSQLRFVFQSKNDVCVYFLSASDTNDLCRNPIFPKDAKNRASHVFKPLTVRR